MDQKTCGSPWTWSGRLSSCVAGRLSRCVASVTRPGFLLSPPFLFVSPRPSQDCERNQVWLFPAMHVKPECTTSAFFFVGAFLALDRMFQRKFFILPDKQKHVMSEATKPRRCIGYICRLKKTATSRRAP